MNDLWRLIPYVRRYTRRVLLAFVAMMGTAGTTYLLPVIAQQLIDVELNPAVESQGYTIYGLILLLFLMKGIFAYLGQYLTAWVGERVIKDLRDDLVSRLVIQPVGFFTERSTGIIISRVISDVEKIHLALTDKLYDLLCQPLIALALIGYLVAKDWKLAVISFVGIPLIAWPVVRFGRKLRRVSTASQERMGDVSTLLHEMVHGIRVVKAFCMERFEHRRFSEATRKLFAMNMKAIRVVAITPPVMELLAGIGVALAFLYGRWVVREGTMTAGDVLTFFGAMLLLYQPLKRLTKVVNAYAQAKAGARRVWEFIDHPTEVGDQPGARAVSRVRGALAFEGVSFRYEDRFVLQNVNLEVAAAEVIAVVGPSGAGKSTLANLIMRFYDPTEGRVLVDGTDLRDVTLRSLREQIALVTQDVVIFNDTVRANLAYGRPEIPLERIERAARAAHAFELIEGLPEGFDTVVGESGVKLSGGERQRLVIARALLKDAPVLILDEATSALDAQSESLVQQALANLMRGRTTIIIAHRLSSVRRANRIVVLDDGRISECGPHAELMEQNGLYSKLVDLQSRGVIAP